MNWAETVFIIEKISEKMQTLYARMNSMQQILTQIAEKLEIDIQTDPMEQ